jgi:hypothetical protein
MDLALPMRQETRLGLNGAWRWLLRGIFRPKLDKVTGEWKELHNEGLQVCKLHLKLLS